MVTDPRIKEADQRLQELGEIIYNISLSYEEDFDVHSTFEGAAPYVWSGKDVHGIDNLYATHIPHDDPDRLLPGQ